MLFHIHGSKTGKLYNDEINGRKKKHHQIKWEEKIQVKWSYVNNKKKKKTNDLKDNKIIKIKNIYQKCFKTKVNIKTTLIN